jgi:deoxyribonuclease V
MRIRRLHRWRVTPREAAAIQRRLARRIVLRPPPGLRVRLVAGVDGAYAGGRVFAAAVVLRLPGLQEVERAVSSMRVPFPYVPGLLSFREAPAFARALRRLRTVPDLLLVDGQGLAHPRRMGIACHLGLLAGVPTVGVAKSVLVGEHAPPARPAGSWTPLVHRGETVGAALRLTDGGSPVLVSPGHLCDLRTAVRLVLACAAGHRLPEPTFLADRAVGEAADAVRRAR